MVMIFVYSILTTVLCLFCFILFSVTVTLKHKKYNIIVLDVPWLTN